jgi:hypothetical protein
MRKTFVGSLAMSPSGVTFPIASPARNTVSARPNGRRVPAGVQRRHAAVRSTKRRPAITRMGTSPQPTR